MKKAKKSKSEVSSSDKSLLKELELLRAENAYLKKLQALVQERIAREKGSELPPLKN
jgi:transposase